MPQFKTNRTDNYEITVSGNNKNIIINLLSQKNKYKI